MERHPALFGMGFRSQEEKLFSIIERSLALVEKLSAEDTEALKQYFAVHKTMTDVQAEMAENIFTDIQVRNRWLTCDCQTDSLPIRARPLLCPVTGPTLRRMPAPPRPPHSVTCCFAVGRAATADEDDPDLDVRPDRARNAGPEFFGVHRAFPRFNDRPGERKTVGQGAERVRRSTHARLLLTLLEKARLNRWDASAQAVKLSDQFAAIRSAARDLSLSERLKVADVLVSRPSRVGKLDDGFGPAIELGHADNMSLRQMITHHAEEWPAGARPHGFLCTVVSSFNGRQVEFLKGDAPRHLVNRPHVFAESRREMTGPFIALISYAQKHPDDSSYCPVGTYAQPCASERDCRPLDSGYERRTLDILLEAQRNARYRFGRTFNIRKPLFDEAAIMPDGNEAPCRPDFVLEVLNPAGNVERHVLVETMGRDTTDYEIAKQTTHERMRRLWGGSILVEHDCLIPSQAAIARSKAQLEERLGQAIREGRQP